LNWRIMIDQKFFGKSVLKNNSKFLINLAIF